MIVLSSSLVLTKLANASKLLLRLVTMLKMFSDAPLKKCLKTPLRMKVALEHLKILLLTLVERKTLQ